MNPDTIEHWSDGEKIGQFEVTKIVQKDDGTVCIVVPLGGITFGSLDELHFNLNDLIKALSGVRRV